jgi:hypothetical protein
MASVRDVGWEVSEMAVETVSWVWPGLVLGVWVTMRRQRRPLFMGPLLFVALAVAGSLIVLAADARSAVMELALGASIVIACAALADFVCCGNELGRPDDDRGGGFPWPARGGDLDGDWWPEFERAFREHVLSSQRTGLAARRVRRPRG